jgi:class 3 adenylate cyclase
MALWVKHCGLISGAAKCVLALFLCCPLAASAAFYLTGDGLLGDLSKEIHYRVDQTNDATFEEVSASPNWIAQDETPFHGTGDPTTVWVRFDPPAVSSIQRLLVHAPLWERVDLYVVRDGVLVDRFITGGLVARSQRSAHISMMPAYLGGFADIEQVPSRHTTVFLRLHSQNQFLKATTLRVSLWDAERVLEAERRDRIGQGLFLGVMLFLVLYNLGLFFVTREPSYLFYVLMEVGFTGGWCAIFGIDFEFLWPQHPEWSYAFIWISTTLGGFGLYQFLRHHLSTWKHFPRTDLLLQVAAFTDLLALPAVFLPVNMELLLKVLLYLSPMGSALVMGVLFLALRSRHPLARNVFLAMVCFGAGISIFAVAEIGLMPQGELAAHAGQIGSVLAGIVLSLGLGFRMQALRHELLNRQLEEERTKTSHEREVRELIEEQNRTLEGRVTQRTFELKVAQEKSNSLLANILPQAIIDELSEKGVTEPRRHEEVSILFTDFAGFTQAVSTIPARRLVQELDEIFKGFDDIINAHGLEKIKTIGDAYMAAAGLPIAAEDHALRCVRAALALAQFIEVRNQTSAMKWNLRIGVHSGAVVAGVVGKIKYAYDVWGDTVNIASRLESSGEVSRVNISAYTYELVREHFDCQYRGKVTAKGKGEIDMYFVLREHPSTDGGPTGG